MYEVVIIGAGISGSYLAKILNEKKIRVLIIEKSKSVGGRFSTKNVGAGLADYGCQYISPKSEVLKNVILDLLKKKLVSEIIFEGNKKAYICPYGLSRIPFFLSLGISSVTNQKVDYLIKHKKNWEIKTNLQSFYAKTVVLTSPINQSKEILNKSNISHFRLPDVNYNSFYSITFTTTKKLNDKIFHSEKDYPWICNNNAKGMLNDEIIYTLSASENKSQELYKMNNIDQIIRIQSDMENIGFSRIENLEIHFWKYGFSNNQNNPSHFYDKNLKIGLCGDSFSVGKVDGSIISANELSKKILGNG